MKKAPKKTSSNEEAGPDEMAAANATAAAGAAAAVMQVLPIVPLNGVAAMLEALIQATGVAPSNLLHQLLKFSPLKQVNGQVQTDGPLDLATKYMAVQCHLLSYSASAPCDLAAVLSSLWMPLLQSTDSNLSLLQMEVVEMLAEAVSKRSAWDDALISVVPLCLYSLNSAISQDNGLLEHLCKQSPESKSTALFATNKPVSVGIACQLLATLLQNAMKLFSWKQCPSRQNDAKECPAMQFCNAVHSRSLPLAVAMLSQISDGSLRHHAIHKLLPVILKASNDFLDADRSMEDGRVGPSDIEQVWSACKTLLSKSVFARYDAFMAMAQLVEFLFGSGPGCTFAAVSKSSQKFDVRNDPQFWDFIKSGLVDLDSVIRKRALFVLRHSLPRVGHAFPANSKQGNMAFEKFPQPLSKREKWAEKEAISLGLGRSEGKMLQYANEKHRWDAFFLLYDTLEEYGTHLVEATWDLQMSLLLPALERSNGKVGQPQTLHSCEMEFSGAEMGIAWISVLWQRGFSHKNPQVRRLVVSSFLDNSQCFRSGFTCLEKEFVLGPFLHVLNDPVHHKDFGLQGVYDGETTRSASKFICAYTERFDSRERTRFVLDLANAMLLQAPCRAGLVAIASCIEAASVGKILYMKEERGNPSIHRKEGAGKLRSKHSGHESQCAEVLETFKLVVDDSKRHYNPKYRARVSCHILRAVCALVSPLAVPVSKVAYFLSSFPRDILVTGGLLNKILLGWFENHEERDYVALDPVEWAYDGLRAMAEEFLCTKTPSLTVTYGDDDIVSWEHEGEKWARMLTSGVIPVHKQLMLVEYVKQQACQVYHRAYMSAHKPEKTLVLLRNLITECQHGFSSDQEDSFAEAVASSLEDSFDELVAYAKMSVSIFWEPLERVPSALPGTVTGKLGGPSQRRLPATLTCRVLQAVLSITTISDGCSWYSNLKRPAPEPVQIFLWRFAWEVVHFTRVQNESDAELLLGAYEALEAACGALAASATPLGVSWGYGGIQAESRCPLHEIQQPGMLVEELVKALLKGVNHLQNSGFLARSRRAVLARFQWCCLDSLLSIPHNAVFTPGKSCAAGASFACAVGPSTILMVFKEALESLDSAGEEYLVPLFRTLRSLMDWGVLEDIDGLEDAYGQSRLQVVWALVKTAWASIMDCNKRKVALIAAFLSTVLHPAIFEDVEMHSAVDFAGVGPLKWLLSRLFHEGARSPRIMRLTTLHVTGLWLKYPATVMYYIPEIQCLALHGGENVDEELDGEIVSSQIAAREYRTLIQCSDPELAEAFANSEIYVRVCVAIMVDEFAQVTERARVVQQEAGSSKAADFGRTFLLSLLQATAEDPSLSKELYKKKSAIHRKKVRAWQMLCLLSRFFNYDLVLRIISVVHTCLYKNNMPSVRQYIENFMVQIFLRYPDLVKDHLLHFLKDYNFKTQALSSYVFIAANVLMFIPCKRIQRGLFEDLFPAILPYMTSHHHSLRSFTQVLIHRLLSHVTFSGLGPEISVDAPGLLANQSLVSIAGFLDANVDCTRIRTSVGKLLDQYDPALARTARGLFSIREDEPGHGKNVEEFFFECAPVAVVDKVVEFLSEARDSLRVAMAADAVALSNENGEHKSGICTEDCNDEASPKEAPDSRKCTVDSSCSTFSNFQKKINSLRFSGVNGCGIDESVECEEELLLSTLESRAQDMLKMRGERQQLIVVASLLGRIPNLAGLARTCEVFKVGSLVVADARITSDRQFQLISVTAEQWIPIVEVPESGLKDFLMQRKREGYCLLGLEQTANSVSIESYAFPKKAVLVLGKEKQGIPVDIIQALDCCVEIPQFGVIRSLNVHVSGAIAVWEYTRLHGKPGQQAVSRLSL